MNELQIENFIDPEKLKEEVKIDVTDLDNTMITHAGLSTYYAQQAVMAEYQYDRFKQYLEIVEANLYGKYKEKLTEETGKKPTETEIKSRITTNKTYQAYQSKLLEAKKIHKLCDIARSSFIQRKDLILEIARDRRKEAEGQMRVMERNSLRDSVLEQLRKSSD